MGVLGGLIYRCSQVHGAGWSAGVSVYFPMANHTEGFASLSGMAMALYLINTTNFFADKFTTNGVPMKVVGTALMGTTKHNYVLTFEVLSILLLACMVGAIMIARKK